MDKVYETFNNKLPISAKTLLYLALTDLTDRKVY